MTQMNWENETTLNPNEPGLEPWMAEALRLGLASSREILGNRQGMVADVMHAAGSIWRSTGGEPRWGALAIEELRATMQSEGYVEEAIGYTLVSLFSFYAYLAKHGQVAAEEAAQVQDQMAPFVAPIFASLLGQLHLASMEMAAELDAATAPRSSASAMLN